VTHKKRVTGTQNCPYTTQIIDPEKLQNYTVLATKIQQTLKRGTILIGQRSLGMSGRSLL
jgi:hypothetical protein